MTRARRLVIATAAAGVVWLAADPARGYEFDLALRTVGQGYQVRRFGVTGASELLNRRRLTQYLDLALWDIAPDAWRGPDGDRNRVTVDVSLRFDSDFGGFLLGRPRGDGAIRELQQNQVDVLQAVLAVRRVGGRLDLQLGRQLHYDLVDFYAFDGAHARLALWHGIGVEGFGGTEVRGELPVSAPIYEIDGTSPGSRDPRTRPAQTQALMPTAGAALFHETLFGATRLAYRRSWSATRDQTGSEPPSGVNAEKVSLTHTSAWGPVGISLGARYDLLTARSDDRQLGLRVRIARRHAVTLDAAYLAPTFDGDSIWNVFSTGDYREARLGYEIRVDDAISAHAAAFYRRYETPSDGPDSRLDPGQEPTGGSDAWGGTLGARWRRGRGFLRAGAYYDDGFGGRRIGGDASGRLAVHPGRLDVEGRLTAYSWRADLRPETNAGFVAGAQVGTRHQLVEGMRLHLLLEDNTGTFYFYQLRALALLDLDVGL